ncbi:hypothetical protein DM01DRAFT_1136590 [Hesseltinella vesiculosa]|uniref:Uncharacterized protein n=1 Tax=Hesseltinella vesiculosa TaxID=101127 RepID=A0A1X2G8E7_9FUNG|nr:hypothetical protein DM01DRAFT_1136590 [Hesseltinella vesiculosa]
MADLVDFLSNLINLNTIASRILDQFVNDRTTFDNVDTLQKLKRKLFNTNDYINVYEQTDTIASKFPVERIVSSLRPWLPCCLHRLNLATLIIALHGDDLSLLEAFNFRHVRPWHPPAFPAVMEDAFVELRSFIYVRLVTEQEQEDNDDDASLDLGGIGERIFPDDSTYGMPSSSPTLNLLEKMERKQQSVNTKAWASTPALLILRHFFFFTQSYINRKIWTTWKQWWQRMIY